MLIIKSGRSEIMKGIEQLNQESIRTLEEKENYKYLGILEADTIKKTKIIDGITKEYLKRTRKLLDTKICRGNLIKEIYNLAVPLVMYSE